MRAHFDDEYNVAVGNKSKGRNVNNDNNVDTVTGAQLALRCLTDCSLGRQIYQSRNKKSPAIVFHLVGSWTQADRRS